jgi:hypothetical protein
VQSYALARYGAADPFWWHGMALAWLHQVTKASGLELRFAMPQLVIGAHRTNDPARARSLMEIWICRGRPISVLPLRMGIERLFCTPRTKSVELQKNCEVRTRKWLQNNYIANCTERLRKRSTEFRISLTINISARRLKSGFVKTLYSAMINITQPQVVCLKHL